MTINDHSIMSLPQAPQGTPPNPEPEFVSALAHAWYDKNVAEDGFSLAHSIPEAGPYRASYAGHRCDRQLHYALTDTDKSNPPTLAAQWSFHLGHKVHEFVQEHLPRAHPSIECEVTVDLRPIGIPGSAHADGVTYLEDGRVDAVVEIKSINGYGFKMSAATFNGPPEGPRSGHVLQAALVGAALNARRVVIAYLSLEVNQQEKSSNPLAAFAAEWQYDMASLQPMVDAEVARIQQIVGRLDMLPKRLIRADDMPRGSIVTHPHPPKGNAPTAVYDPHDGSLIGLGTWWGCVKYCSWRDRCIADGAGSTPVTVGRKS